ncbi:MAG: hypothetical protein UT02_C0052G0005 [Parcubacteria group bacterium GW2011_GWC2_38_7]|nr:MAG: hypothetical protein UT02_C0052G0005 [Parcubacteria group bacterium GW2011_GWC2_38_7]
MLRHFKQLGKDSVIYLGGTFLAKLISIFVILIYTRVLPTQLYGTLDIVLISTIALTTLVDLGLSTALSMFYFQTIDKNERKIVISTAFIFSAFVSICMCLIAISASPQIATIFLKNRGYAGYLIIAFATLPFSQIITLGANLFRLNFKPVSYLTIILGNAILGATVSIYLVIVSKMGLSGIFYGSLVSAIIFSLITIYLNRDTLGWKFSLQKIKQLLQIGLPLAPAGLLIWIMDSSGRYFLVHFKTLEEIAWYSIGLKFAGLLSIIAVAFKLANTPFQFSVAENFKAKKIYSKTLTYYLLIGAFLVATLSIFGRELLQIATPSQYLEAYKIIPLLAFSFIIYGLYQIIGIGLILTKKTKFFTYSIAIGAITSLLFNRLLVPSFGNIGSATATVLSYLTGLAFIYFWSQRFYHINFAIKKILTVYSLLVVLIIIGLLIQGPLLIVNILLKLLLICILILILYFNLETTERRILKSFLSNALKIKAV